MSLARVSAILVVIWIVVSAYIIVTPIDGVLPAATDHAQSIDFLFKFMIVASVAVFLIVEGFLLYFCLRYRLRKGDSNDLIGSIGGSPGGASGDHRGVEAVTPEASLRRKIVLPNQIGQRRHPLTNIASPHR